MADAARSEAALDLADIHEFDGCTQSIANRPAKQTSPAALQYRQVVTHTRNRRTD